MTISASPQFHVHGIFRQTITGNGFAGLYLIDSDSIVVGCQLALAELPVGILVHPQQDIHCGNRSIHRFERYAQSLGDIFFRKFRIDPHSRGQRCNRYTLDIGIIEGGNKCLPRLRLDFRMRKCHIDVKKGGLCRHRRFRVVISTGDCRSKQERHTKYIE